MFNIIPHIVLLFPTVEFTVFFVLTFTIWLSIKINYRLQALCIFNIIFYGIYNPFMLLYLILWTILIYLGGKYLKIKYLIISFAILSLIFWKLLDAKFIIISSISTPLGVSFFTFQGLTYLFARMKLPITKPDEHITEYWGFIKLFTFIGFFPTIFSGPILRAKYWEHNLNNPFELNQQNFSYAMSLIAIGMFYKLCLSSIFHDYVSLAYANPLEENSLTLLIGMYAYTFEIYHDFAGYSLMAIGISLLYGFGVPANFKQPYLSLNIREFWQKWHISFSFWLRDYFYFSLGGSRLGNLNHIKNTMIVMLICGAWHGLNSNYLIWGLLHGTAVVTYHLINNKLKIPKFICWFITFHFISLTWIFFRSPNAITAIYYIKELFNFNDYFINFNSRYLLIITLFFVAIFFQYLEKIFFSKEIKFNNLIFSPISSGFLWAAIFIAILIASPSGMPPFIYFSY